MANITFTVLESANNQAVTKELSLNNDGSITKQSLAYNLAKGIAYTISCEFSDFIKHYEGIYKHQALAYGIMKEIQKSYIASKAYIKAHNLPNIIERSNNRFHYPNLAGLQMLDIDDATMNFTQLYQILTSILPALNDAPLLHRASTSSNITHMETGKTLRGETGFRILVAVDNAQAIPELGKLISEHLWLNGHGYFAISKAGTLLERTLIDKSVWQPSRIDFAAPAICVAPLQQQPLTVTGLNVNNPALDTQLALQHLQLTKQQELQIQTLKQQARKLKETEAHIIRQQWLASKTTELAIRHQIPTDKIQSILHSALEFQKLSGEFEIHLADGQTVTVAQILENPTLYHEMRCADPIEPDYHNDKRIGYISLRPNKLPYIYSHAHGGIFYKLVQPIIDIRIAKGNNKTAVDETVNVLANKPNVFKFGDELVIVEDEKVKLLSNDVPYFGYYLNSIIQYHNYKGETNPSKDLVNQIISVSINKPGFQEIVATSNMPFLRSDGSVCYLEGYDKQSQVFLLEDHSHIDMVMNPTLDEVKQALQYIYEPIKHFPFDSDVSRAVYVSALLTTVCRKSVDISPAFALDAPSPGTGKSLLTESIGILVHGKKPSVMPFIKSEEEKRKALLSLLIDNTEVFCVDNIKGTFESASFEAFLTAPMFQDRLLGQSKIITLPNRCITLFNGNNLHFSGDLNRRVLKARLDANCETPYERKFDVNVKDFFMQNRTEMIYKLLTLFRGYFSLGAKDMTQTSMGSFDKWDRIVRQTVCWLSEIQTDIPLADPCLSIASNYENDNQDNKRLLTSWHNVFGSQPQLSKDVIDVIEKNSNAKNLKEVLISLNNDKPLTSTSLGHILRRFNGIISENLKFIRLDTNKDGSAQWKIDVITV